MSDNKSKEKTFSRRDFMKTTGVFTGGILGGSLLGGVIGSNFSNDILLEDPINIASDENTQENANNYNEARVFFKRRDDFQILEMATERIFPEDEHGPGAIGLGVPYFIDKQLAGPWGENSNVYMRGPFHEGETPLNRGDIFLHGVRKINEVSNDEHGDTFINLEEEQQDEILQLFADGEIEMTDVDSSQFFQLLRQTTIEGAYSDPVYGGNKNMEGWKMKEYPGPRLSYRNRMEEDEAIDEEFVFIEPISLSNN